MCVFLWQWASYCSGAFRHNIGIATMMLRDINATLLHFGKVIRDDNDSKYCFTLCLDLEAMAKRFLWSNEGIHEFIFLKRRKKVKHEVIYQNQIRLLWNFLIVWILTKHFTSTPIEVLHKDSKKRGPKPKRNSQKTYPFDKATIVTFSQNRDLN